MANSFVSLDKSLEKDKEDFPPPPYTPKNPVGRPRKHSITIIGDGNDTHEEEINSDEETETNSVLEFIILYTMKRNKNLIPLIIMMTVIQILTMMN